MRRPRPPPSERRARRRCGAVPLASLTSQINALSRIEPQADRWGAVADGVGDQFAHDEVRDEGSFLLVPGGQTLTGEFTGQGHGRGALRQFLGGDLNGAKGPGPGQQESDVVRCTGRWPRLPPIGGHGGRRGLWPSRGAQHEVVEVGEQFVGGPGPHRPGLSARVARCLIAVNGGRRRSEHRSSRATAPRAHHSVRCVGYHSCAHLGVSAGGGPRAGGVR